MSDEPATTVSDEPESAAQSATESPATEDQTSEAAAASDATVAATAAQDGQDADDDLEASVPRFGEGSMQASAAAAASRPEASADESTDE